MRRLVMLLLLLSLVSVASVFARDYFTLQGGKLAGEELTAPDKTIMLFWTTWCPYCRDQLKFLGDRCSALERRGFTVRLINIGEPQAKVMQFVKDRGLGHCQIVLDESGSLARQFSIQGFPTYLFYYRGQELTRANVLSEAALEKTLNIYD
jgi:thiol-disulfide isomerase/thioredoxin